MLYIASQYDRDLDRAREVGQLTKVDPSVPGGRIVWKVDDQGGSGGGLYGPPAVVGDMVYAGTNGGRLLGIDRATGAIRWPQQSRLPLRRIPGVVEGVLLLGDR